MKAIVAMDSNRVIGYRGEIPWHLKDDLKWFRYLTTGVPYQNAISAVPYNFGDIDSYGILIMGRKTYEKVGSLSKRYTYVLTRDKNNAKLPTRKPLSRYIEYGELLSKMPNIPNTSNNLNQPWVVGGAEIYELLLPYCEEVFVTHVIGEHEGDTFMPPFEDRFPHQELLKETKDYSIVRHFR